MTASRAELERRRDDALRDLVDLDRQFRAGELTAEAHQELRLRYEAEATGAIAGIAEQASREQDGHGQEAQPTPRAVRGRRPTGRHVVYGVGLATVLAVVALLPKYLLDRPPTGLVTGNEVMQQSRTMPGQTPATPRNLAWVTDAEMEKVVEANPNVIGMRLALAERYADKGRYDLAVVHYTTVLRQSPDNAEAQAHLGWILLQLDRPRQAAELVDRAVRKDPSLIDALWFQANVRLYGLRDAEGAVATLDTMRARRDLAPQVRRQVEELRQTALQDGGRK